jgi:hypothetical protein
MSPGCDRNDGNRAEQKRDANPQPAVTDETGRTLAIIGTRGEIPGQEEKQSHEKRRIHPEENAESGQWRVGKRDFGRMRGGIGLHRMMGDHEEDQDDTHRIHVTDPALPGGRSRSSGGSSDPL